MAVEMCGKSKAPRVRPTCGPPRFVPAFYVRATRRAFWQARFYDFNVYSKGKKREKLNYMNASPEIRGLVRHPKDWAWNSWGFYWGGTAGLVTIDVEE
jgi:hypothetical protein